MSRRPWDWYPTPDWATKVVVEKYQISGKVFEPCTGQGDITNAIIKYTNGAVIPVTNDLNTECPADTHWDATSPENWDGLYFDWVVSNPPFALAIEIIKQAMKHADNVLMLLRMSFLEPVEHRGLWLRDNPLKGLTVLPRISFSGDGKTDSVTCGWMYWSKTWMTSHIDVVHPALEHEDEMFQ